MTTPVASDDPWLTRDEVAARILHKPKTLAMWAMQGTGPKYYRFNGGPCRYRLSDVVAWEESQATGGVT
ncbi:helix-turn-helix transcriptional regulator [Mycobacteroides abscessus]|uniref:helix-turn-helix transcriptional regulator n=1 Tax=Mycobacteroides abscessus TaxID=36809 RepID=UPI00092982AD|nr:hypothetical protein [Mycobacteroides abscessus]PVB44304.1 DNA-binding protein [Mycobacteroides abscessus]QSN53759.1 DNA-binding protein [Mycobacteroides abscessus subsp. abscessus]SHS37677.1 Uncharacterised protein [Mycobacteroides abscessus subsp. abscessus]SHS53329.1 Uncharacterised protein [Mycobacteroides abscessus subsp. abscessus]SHS85520.1 Uncharacterised protein [Mycobacteroides abscessus subsp. abscessus]